MNDFENAGKYLQAAKDAGTITPNGERYLSLVDKYKELWEKEKQIRDAKTRPTICPR